MEYLAKCIRAPERRCLSRPLLLACGVARSQTMLCPWPRLLKSVRVPGRPPPTRVSFSRRGGHPSRATSSEAIRGRVCDGGPCSPPFSPHNGLVHSDNPPFPDHCLRSASTSRVHGGDVLPNYPIASSAAVAPVHPLPLRPHPVPWPRPRRRDTLPPPHPAAGGCRCSGPPLPLPSLSLVRGDTPPQPSARGANLRGRLAVASTLPPHRSSAATYLRSRPRGASIAVAVPWPPQQRPPAAVCAGR